MAKRVPMRLKYLRVGPKHAARAAAPCAEPLNALLACWRLSGVDTPGCAGLAAALARCSQQATAAARPRLQPSVNYLLGRMMSLR